VLRLVKEYHNQNICVTDRSRRGFHRWGVGSGVLGLLLLAAMLPWGWAENRPAGEAFSSDLTMLGLEELMSIEITSAGKKVQKLSDVAAAVFVITQEDIQRSGVTSIPEALRMVPGVQVARIDSNKWAITVRGFNSGFANKLLVLIDGRAVYTPTFSGVFWDVQDTLLTDIERIEVIRGPGAALWGANAVNGVINIITKRAQDTQGGLATAGGHRRARFWRGALRDAAGRRRLCPRLSQVF
jgi:iron complex outermembrane receptor protein